MANASLPMVLASWILASTFRKEKGRDLGHSFPSWAQPLLLSGNGVEGSDWGVAIATLSHFQREEGEGWQMLLPMPYWKVEGSWPPSRPPPLLILWK